jgi:FAD/FMN-containing dehydrogenase
MNVDTERARQVADDLRQIVRGDVLFDAVDRVLYSTAACMFEVWPLGAVAPRDAADVQAVVRYARERGIPVTARGGGTGVAGQSVGEGLILVFTRHMAGIRHIDPAGRRVEVDPGVTLAELNAALAPYGLRFPPDPSSGDAATLGGMIGTNAAGTHTLKYGTVKDWVESLDVVLDTGDAARVRRGEAVTVASAGCARLAGIAGDLRRFLEPRRDVLAGVRPRVTKNSCGYNVYDLLRDGGVDLLPLLIGSEGTLAVTAGATLRVDPKPAHLATLRILLDAVEQVAPVVHALRAFSPSGCELIERAMIDLVRGGVSSLADEVPPATRSAILAEFDGADVREVEDRAAAAAAAVRGLGTALDVRMATTQDERLRLWALRKKASPLLERIPGPRRSTRLVEDGVVPPDRLADYVHGLERIFERRGLRAFMFGHAGDGHLHVNVFLDRNDPYDRELMRHLLEEVTDLLRTLGGTLTGEHGDGLMRAGFLERLFGPELMEVFREVKRIWDPREILNPGKKVPAKGADFVGLIPARPGRSHPGTHEE